MDVTSQSSKQQLIQDIINLIIENDHNLPYNEPAYDLEQLVRYVAFAYNKHDPAHDLKHVYTVLSNAYKITKNHTLTQNEHKIFAWVMLMHDARDHKLVATGVCRPQEEIDLTTKTVFGAEFVDIINYIHNNCSYSKREKSAPVPENSLGITDTLRKILQDADWIEAIGEIGIQRCQDYHNNLTPHYTPAQIDKDVYKHINEKLLHIRGAVNFDSTRDLIDAEGREKPLHDFITYYTKTYL